MVSQKTSKSAKIFSLETFRLYGMVGYTYETRDDWSSAANLYVLRSVHDLKFSAWIRQVLL